MTAAAVGPNASDWRMRQRGSAARQRLRVVEFVQHGSLGRAPAAQSAKKAVGLWSSSATE